MVSNWNLGEVPSMLEDPPQDQGNPGAGSTISIYK